MRVGLQFAVLTGFLSLHACASARPLEVAQLPAGEFADTEVSTNIAFAVERLAVDCGQLQQTRLSHGFGLKRRQMDAAWNLVKVTRRGCGTACELVKVKGYMPGFRLEVR